MSVTTKAAPALLVVLGSLTAIAPLATDIYVPAFPELGRSLTAGEPAVQLSMTAFLIGLAVGQLVLGPLSDRLGRRRVLVTGVAAFTVLSVGCALAPSIELFVVLRLLQGLGGAAGIVVARAVVTDEYTGPAAAKRFSALASIVFVAPVVAPVLGAGLLSIGSWRLVFVALAGIGVLLLVGVVWGVPETLPVERRTTGGLAGTVRAMRGLLGRRALVGCLLVLGMAFAAFFTYISAATFVFQDLYGFSDTQYSLMFAGNALGMFVAGFVVSRLAGRVPLPRLLGVGLGGALAAASVLAVVLLASDGSAVLVWACLFVMVFSFGIGLPALVTITQDLGRDAPGATSGLVGASQFVFGAAAAPVTGLFGTTSALPMAVVMVCGLGLAVVGLRVARLGSGQPGVAV